MFQYLKIENLALLKSVSLEFKSGFSVVTGETGAGKSILLGALNFLSGARSNKDVIRQNENRLLIEASFFFNENQVESINDCLSELNLPQCDEGNMILMRSLDQSKQSKIKINGSLATLAQLKSLGEFWIDFHGPGEPQKLFKDSCQLELLDAYCGLKKELKAYRVDFQKWTELKKELNKIESTERLDTDEIMHLKNELNKMDQVDLTDSSVQELESNFNKISSSQECQDTLVNCSSIIKGETGLITQLNILNNQLVKLVDLDPSLDELLSRAESIQIEIDELSRDLDSETSSFEFDQQTTDIINSKMSIFQELKRRYGGSIKSLQNKQKEMQDALLIQDDIDGVIERINSECLDIENSLSKQALTIRKNRIRGAKELAQKATEILLKLGFKKASLTLEINPLKDGKFCSSGQDTCRFLFSPNSGNSLLPLNKIASSGETARVMLALKSILAHVDNTPVLVFDEVDANVGGEIGRSVGFEMAQISDNHQVFCITHLPQVASCAGQHFFVDKRQNDKETAVNISSIHDNKSQRISEIARMLGDRNSESALAHARELLG